MEMQRKGKKLFKYEDIIEICPVSIRDQLEKISFSTDYYFMKQNDLKHWVYILLSGEAQAYSETKTGLRHVRYIHHASEVIGEIEAITNGPIICSVVATSPGEAIKVSQNFYLEWIRTDPEFAMFVVGQLAESLAIMSTYTSMNMQYSLKQRLMQFFLQKHQQFGNPFYVDKKLTADLFGCHLRSVNRVIKELESKNLLGYEKGRFQIPDINKFKDALDHQE
jgi:CRP-like cAMP-binding protein